MTRVWAIMMAIGFVAAPHLAAANAGNPPAGAPGVSGPSAPREADRTPSHPHEIVRYGIAQLQAHLNQHRNRDAQRIEAFLGTTIALFFDFETMGRWAAGPFYRRLQPSERERFHAKIRDLFLGALARNLGSYGGTLPAVRVLPPMVRRWGDEMVVRAQVALPRTYPIAVDFRFYRRGNEWRIFDVAANGFSAVTYYRRHFARLVRLKGTAALTN